MTGENDYITIKHLFDSIGVIEKGIEKIFHYLLQNKKIENLKVVCEKYGLTLKRGYKICAALNDLGMVQILDRPMKIHLIPDPIAAWQILVNKRIEDLKLEFQEKQSICRETLEEFMKKYSLDESLIQEPVEFINFDINAVEDIYYPLLAKNICKIALGIEYENPLIPILIKLVKNNIALEIKQSIKEGILRILDNLKKIEVQGIVNNELVKSLLTSDKYSLLVEYLKKIEPKFEMKQIEIHITEEPFSNFNLTDAGLIQPSFDPSNRLIGAYIIRNKNIYQIFDSKYNELFKKSIPINEFIKQDKDLVIAPLSDIQCLALCML